MYTKIRALLDRHVVGCGVLYALDCGLGLQKSSWFRLLLLSFMLCAGLHQNDHHFEQHVLRGVSIATMDYLRLQASFSPDNAFV